MRFCLLENTMQLRFLNEEKSDDNNVSEDMDVDDIVEVNLAKASKLNKEIKNNIEAAQEKQKKEFMNRKRRNGPQTSLAINDIVLMKNVKKLNRKGSRMEDNWLGPYKIVEMFPKGQVSLSKNGTLLARKVNISHLKPYVELVNGNNSESVIPNSNVFCGDTITDLCKELCPGHVVAENWLQKNIDRFKERPEKPVILSTNDEVIETDIHDILNGVVNLLRKKS